MKKLLAHRQLLKQQFYSFKMVESKSITERLMKFNKILDDLANIEVRLNCSFGPLFSPFCRNCPPILKFDNFGPSIIFLNYKNVM